MISAGMYSFTLYLRVRVWICDAEIIKHLLDALCMPELTEVVSRIAHSSLLIYVCLYIIIRYSILAMR